MYNFVWELDNRLRGRCIFDHTWSR